MQPTYMLLDFTTQAFGLKYTPACRWASSLVEFATFWNWQEHHRSPGDSIARMNLTSNEALWNLNESKTLILQSAVVSTVKHLGYEMLRVNNVYQANTSMCSQDALRGREQGNITPHFKYHLNWCFRGLNIWPHGKQYYDTMLKDFQPTVGFVMVSAIIYWLSTCSINFRLCLEESRS